ncbi:LuxR family transcriptional regulator [Paracoccus sp. M683]|uniref:LuxR family transcriptional regulator n=1 Tax=Paracoccus sp. M683 TaxID=2594268 RepID=UPI00117E2D0B|nr:LuxR family transcriptional regulator [Paracoccus sp. M683]TRW94285.1 LuxR family transcriptional regulator [Paracoccus sp. M683]
MLHDLIPSFDGEVAKLNELAPSGWIMGFNLTYRGPEHLHNGYPDGWRKIYEERNYFFGDPIAAWTMLNEGAIRWSEVKIPDMRGVMPEARKFGLNYGVAISRKVARKRSFLTISRADREFRDDEILTTQAKFSLWNDLVVNRASLTDGEIDVLRCFRDGLGQAETAETLGISESTVKQRAVKACAKLNAKTRTQAVALAVARNYL